jgi:hypothetical protein
LTETEDNKNLIGIDGSMADYMNYKPIPGVRVEVLSADNVVLETLTAQGRVETYTNVIPKYFLCHLTYRLNVQPKKKK